MRPRLFLRTANFYGRGTYRSFPRNDGGNLLDSKPYADFAENIGMPVLCGKRQSLSGSGGEAHFYEAMTQDRKALQAGTSFSDKTLPEPWIKFQSVKGERRIWLDHILGSIYTPNWW